jgi:hypothetical protein
MWVLWWWVRHFYRKIAILRAAVLTLKIPPMFVRVAPLQGFAIALTFLVGAIASPAALRLNLCVLPDGIEHPWQHDLLKRHDCDEGQRYCIGRPFAAGAFETDAT